MKCKKWNFMVAYNIQSAVDYDTKLTCTINVTKNPTDHYELPNISERAIRNNNPTKIIKINLHIKKIDGLIPNKKQRKEKIGKLNSNPYHKDHLWIKCI